MGIYLNPGNENFKRIISGDIYVDKTMMIEATNRFIDSGNNYICVSRPRRFGKTFAGNMLSAYYSKGCDSKALFSGFKIAHAPGYEEKRCFDSLSHYEGNLLFVGISYDEKAKLHSCRIEKLVK